MTETVPEFGGCTWPLDPACLGEEWETMDTSVKERSAALASATLVRLTGHRVSNCPRTVRPCVRNNRRLCFIPFEAGSLHPFYPGQTPAGTWTNACNCQTQHTCATDCEVPLPPPVGRVDQVKLDGVVVAPTDYRVDGNLLVWMGVGECPWSEHQDLTKPDTEPGTFSVTYLNAYPVDALGAYAAGVLALEYAKACTSKGKCRLPSGVRNLTRNGVSMEIVTGAFPDGNTGIREVDSFIALWNPRHLTHAATVYSPDIRSTR
jgi:hypothetical protein